jgi:selenide,water dikinase
LSVPADDRVLIDYRTADDAGVYKWDEDRALVQTVDFFTPIVDDPYIYGQIAAANAMSDVWAMGGRPLTALAIAGFPSDVDSAVIATIFAGGMEMLRRERVALLGGHTVQDQEVKFGYAITGEVHPSRLWANSGARPGDALLLTKALGTGVIATAIKAGRAPQEAVDGAIRSMLAVNRGARDALQALPGQPVHGCTDVTGFGLVGHGCEMAAASGATLEIDARLVPLLDGALDLVERNTPRGSRTNAQHFAASVRVAADIDPRVVNLLHDPQTSGGLLVSVEAAHAGTAQAALQDAGMDARIIGRVVASSGARVVVR